MANANDPLPPLQHLPPSRVIARMAEEGRVLRLSWLRILLLAIIAGCFITMGALFSVLVATQVAGPQAPAGGARFSTGGRIGFRIGPGRTVAGHVRLEKECG